MRPNSFRWTVCMHYPSLWNSHHTYWEFAIKILSICKILLVFESTFKAIISFIFTTVLWVSLGNRLLLSFTSISQSRQSINIYWKNTWIKGQKNRWIVWKQRKSHLKWSQQASNGKLSGTTTQIPGRGKNFSLPSQSIRSRVGHNWATFTFYFHHPLRNSNSQLTLLYKNKPFSSILQTCL